MAKSKQVVGELIYEIKGDDSQYTGVINKADTATENLGKTMNRSKGSLDGMITSLAGAYLGWQGVQKAIELTIGSAISYESAFAGVRKTVDGTEQQLKALSDEFIAMSKTMPTTADEFAKIGEIAGQLGVPIEQIGNFSKTIAQIADTTNLTQEEAATDFARFANIMQMPLENIGRLGSAVVDLGNKGASTEAEIIQMALRIAGAGKTLGMTEAQVLGWSNALSSLGIEAEMGGSAISRLMIDMSASVSKGGKDLTNFAKVAGMSTAEFKKKFKDDANGAMLAFFEGLQKIQKGGGDTIGVLNNLGISEIRQRDMMLRVANGGDVLAKSINDGTTAFANNTALQTEAEKRYKTTSSQLAILKNNWTDLGRQLGFVVLPVVNVAIQLFGTMAKTVAFAVDAIKTAVMGMGTGVLMGFKLIIQGIEKFINFAIEGANKINDALGTGKHFDKISISVDGLTKNIEAMKTVVGKSAQETANSFWIAGGAVNTVDINTKELAKTQTLLKKGVDGSNSSINDLVNSLNDNSAANKKAADTAKELADNMKSVKDESTDLGKKGAQALKDLAKESEKSIKEIKANITDLKKDLVDLKNDLTENLASEDKTMAEKIVDEQLQIEELKKKIAESQAKLAESQSKETDETKKKAQELIDMQEKLVVLQKKQTEQTAKTTESAKLSLKNEIEDLTRKISEAKALSPESSAIADAKKDLTTMNDELKKRQDALKNVTAQNPALAPAIDEATRRAGLTDLERAQEDYIAKKAQIQLDYDQKKKELEDKLKLEEDNLKAMVEVTAAKQAEITMIIELANKRFKDLSDKRVQMTKDETDKQITYYKALAEAMAATQRADTTAEVKDIKKQKFSVGGYVNNGGEVHAGEYVIPANMVAKYGGLVKALEGIRTGTSSSNTINNNITMNNAINEQIDMDAVLKNMSFELNK